MDDFLLDSTVIDPTSRKTDLVFTWVWGFITYSKSNSGKEVSFKCQQEQ